MSELLERILVCPVCHGDLPVAALLGGGSAECTGCGRSYAGRHLVPDPPPDADVADKWETWERLQANAVPFYEQAPGENLSVGRREDARAFADFAQVEGAVLDVGCGPQELPSYAAGAGGDLVGIDPLEGAPRRRFAFVQGIGEYLPFRDQSFDRVLFGATLDHMLSPQRVLRETHRVLRPGGSVAIWFGDVDAEPEPHASLRRRLAAATRGMRARLRGGPDAADLEVPEGAEDHFHFFHPKAGDIRGWLAAAGLEAGDEESLGVNRFLRAYRAR